MDLGISKTTDLLELELPIIYHEPPDFSQLRARDAIKHVFDSITCKVCGTLLLSPHSPPSSRDDLTIQLNSGHHHAYKSRSTRSHLHAVGFVKFSISRI